MIDTHSHLLPKVDHGCPDMETSVKMAQAAVEAGTTTIVCTPHLQSYDPELVDRIRATTPQVRDALVEVGVDVTLLTGFEVDLSVVVSMEVEELKHLAIEDTPGVIILEMPYHGWPAYLEQTLFRLAAAGLTPVLAHPERNDRVQSSPEAIESCVKTGAVVQATVASLTGEFGKAPERAFREMLSLGYVSMVASDAHAYRTDGWTLTPIVESLGKELGDAQLSVLLEENPERLLSGRPLLKIQPKLEGTSSARRGLGARRGSRLGRRSRSKD